MMMKIKLLENGSNDPLPEKETRMIKKSIRTFIGLAFIVILAACSSLPIPGLSTQPSSTSQPAADPSNAAIDNKLAVGILRLEGSDLAITSQQAVELLAVWKAVRVMTTDKSASTIEIAALYRQTLQTLTAEQIQAIQQMSWTQAELNTLMQDLGVQANQSASTSSSTSKSSQTLTSSSAAGGDFPPGDFGGPGGLGSQINAVTSSQSQTTTTNSTSTTSATRSASAAPSSTASQINLNSAFADAVVSLLQQRAGL